VAGKRDTGPPAEAAERYVDFMGGAEAVLRRARDSFAAGDFRWVVQVVNHVLFADPGNAGARALQADALEQLGYGSENGTWRNFFLTGALELREGSVGTPTVTASQDFLHALTLDQLFDSLAIRVDGPRCWDADLTIRFGLHDAEPVTARLRRGVLVHTTGATPEAAGPDLEIDLAEADLPALLLGVVSLDELTGEGRAETRGDAGRLAELLGCLSAPDPDFAVVTP
jgi:alkyl sulfatase BDS1-like metallo-beta-lactamase superfamily hydrolase